MEKMRFAHILAATDLSAACSGDPINPYLSCRANISKRGLRLSELQIFLGREATIAKAADEASNLTRGQKHE